jgi:hypothetical protein
MNNTHRCPRCGQTKPISEYPAGGKNRFNRCSRCKADEMAAYKAGMRKDSCAVCGTAIDGVGICVTCVECIDALGGLDGLKRAVRATRFMQQK